MNITHQTRIGDIVASDINLAMVLNNYQIDFCCGGDQTLYAICQEKGLDFEKIVEELSTNQERLTTIGLQFDQWRTDLLIDYINKYQHDYIRTQGPKTLELLQKVATVHGEANPRLKQIYILFRESLVDLHQHLEKEEVILFPFIQELLYTKEQNLKLPEFHCGSIENPISVMISEHANEGDRFRMITELSHNYSCPDYACDSYKLVMQLLKEFESNLHLHIHVENNILFHRAVELQEELSKN